MQDRTSVHADTVAGPLSETAAAEPAPTIDGYEIECELGRGGMGVVYRALHLRLQRRVALKTILSEHAQGEALQRFLNEAHVVARLAHPNIVQIHEVGEVSGRPFFSLELVSGGNLEEQFGGKPQAWRPLAKTMATLARAVHAAHEQGVIHRDLKPANVLLTRDGTPKITDFGIAKQLDAQRQTQTGKILGTPCYMAPEQALGRNELVGPATDIYALGAILYDGVTGRPPFLAESTMDTLMQALTREPVPLRALQPLVPRDLEVICLKCLEKRPERRYSSALELAEDLERLLSGSPISARPVGRLEHAVRWARRSPAAAALVVVSCLAIITLLAGSLWFTRRLQRELAQTEQARREAMSAETALRVQLLRTTAKGIDSDLRQLASVPRVIGAALGEREDWSQPQLLRWLKEELEHEPEVFGIAAAFEPRSFHRSVEDFALYAYRGPSGIVSKRLLPPEYTPIYREWAWYRDAKSGGSFSDPYIDEGGGGIPMVTFSMPIERNGRRVGVVTADLSLEYFRALDASLNRAYFGARAYAFMITHDATLVSHPQVAFRFPAPGSHLKPSELARDPVWARLLSGEVGQGRSVDPTTAKPAELFFAPIVVAGWSCVVVVPE
jgi:hypothetical protein